MRPHSIPLLMIGVFSMLLLSLNAIYLNIEGPVNATLTNGQSIYLGRVGPGESFYVLANSTTTNASGTFINIGWDTLKAVSLPRGWSSQQSPLYANPMKMKITVPPTARNGTYKIIIQAINVQNLSRLGNLTINAFVNVTPNVLNVSVSPKTFSSGIGQQITLYIKINNTGISDDPFNISAANLPAWNLTKTVISLHSRVNTFTYPIFLNEPGVYNFNMTITATTSSLIKRVYPETFTVQASLLNDYNAVGQGVILSPVVFDPAYSFMYLLSLLYKLIVPSK